MKRLNNIFMSVLFVLGSAGIGTAAAHGNVWTPGEVDPNTPSQSIQGEEQAVVPAEGTFSEWDPTNPGPGPGPTDPKDWIDVMIPARVLFGQTDKTGGRIVSPVYRIENRSAAGVRVSVGDFRKGTDADKLPDLTLNMENDTVGQTLSLVHPSAAPTFPTELTLMPNQNDVTEFSFSGNVGEGFEFGAPIRPRYELVLRFEAVGV
ncbi:MULTISPECIES: hypothetical protein [unclassified Enterococcus]|jgi:hypothetical protein|uniref:hypothetical protein n=1 Tax=unclassified Enterococcus TaxID=2608891 RepID=UPI003D2AF1B6